MTNRIKLISNRIVDTRANQMHRYEARVSFERLQFKLEHVVRTKLKQRKSIYGDDVYEPERKLMRKFRAIGKEDVSS